MWLNLYGCETVRHKLKNGLKTQIMHFLPVFELMSDSLTTMQVEIHKCPLHQSILLTQGPIHEIFTIFFLRIGDFEKRPFWIFFYTVYVHCPFICNLRCSLPAHYDCCCCCSVFHTFMNDINKHIYTLIRRANKVQCRHQSSCDRRNGIFTRLFLISVTLHSCRSSLLFPI